MLFRFLCFIFVGGGFWLELSAFAAVPLRVTDPYMIQFSDESLGKITGLKSLPPTHCAAWEVSYHLGEILTHDRNRLTTHLISESVKKAGVNSVHEAYFLYPDGSTLGQKLLADGLATLSEDIDLIPAEMKEVYQLAQQVGAQRWQQRESCRRTNFYRYRLPPSYQRAQLPVLVGTITKVIDSRHFVIDHQFRVRLHGLALPLGSEAADQCFREKAAKISAEKLLGSIVAVTRPWQWEDTSFWLERYVWWPRKNWESVNAWSIEAGVARLDPSYQGKHQTAWQQKQNTVYGSPTGAWHQCRAQILPSTISPRKNDESSCLIKGNITGPKKAPIKKYHTADSPWYERTVAEACFATEAAAQEAGFVRVR